MGQHHLYYSTTHICTAVFVVISSVLPGYTLCSSLLCHIRCFSTKVPRNLKVLLVASNSSTKSNRETGTKRHLCPLGAFSGLLVRPKCICGQTQSPEARWWSLQCSPRPPSRWGGCLLPPPQEPFAHV